MAIINGNNSGNTLNGTNADDIINGLGGNDTINGRGGNDTIDGGSGSDEISGGAGHDAIYGGAGNDYVNGNGGNDRIEGGTGSDELNGGSGLDLLYGGDGNDTLSGGGDADTLFGEIGRDTLGGGAGNDVLVGGAGADWLTGGSGSDTYLYAAVSDSTTSASDILYGFTPGIDRIDVTALLGVTDLLWSDAGPAPNGLWVGQSGGNTFVYADTNGDSTADFRIRVDGLVTLTASDFLGVQSGVTPPVATPDTASVSEDTAPLATGNVLGNDSGTGLAVTAVSFGATAGTVGTDLAGDWGVLRLSADGSYTYTLDSSAAVQALAAGQVVQETFTYTASNSDGDATTNLVVTITGTNDAPIAADMSASVSEDVTVNGTLAAATDADGDLVGYALAGAPANGTALVNGDGTFSYTPNPNYNGPDSFTYQVSDSHGGSSTYTVSITVDPVNDSAVVSGDVSGSVVEDFVLSTGGVLAVADADSGEAAFVPQVNAVGAYGAFTVDAAGNWSYVLDNASSAVQGLGAGETVTDGFAVSSLDGTGTATVSVTVTGRGDHPPQLTPAVEVFGPTDGIVTTDIGTGHDKGCHVIQQADGKLVVAAYGLNETGNEDFALIRYRADGSLDTNFGGGDGIVTTPIGTGHDYGRSVIQLDDGKLVVAGFATNSAGFTDFALVRYHADGSLDTSFGGGAGIVTTSVGSQNDEAYTVIQQSDGKLVVAGLAFDAAGISNFAMARYNADGSLDASFGGGSGIVSTAVGPSFDFGFTVIQQSDGKLVMAGFAWTGPGLLDIALTRYNADGSLDASFGGGDGIVTTPVGTSFDYGFTAVQQQDGKLVVAGFSAFAGTGVGSSFAILRYNIDGSLDTSFGGGDGIVTTAVGAGNDRGFSVIQQADGKLVLAGHALGASGDYDYALVRYNADGSLDTSFGGTGIVTTPVSASDDHGITVMQQSDGKLVMVGNSIAAPGQYEIALVRYNADGSLDTTFGEAGMPDQAVTEGVAFAIVVPANLFADADGDVITYSATLGDGSALPSWIAFDTGTGMLSGTAPAGAGEIDVRVTATDSTGLSASDAFTITIAPRPNNAPQLTPAVEVFGPTDGIVTTDIGTGHDKGCHVIQQADGKLVVAAYGLNEAGNEDFALIRYHADGSLDTSFGGGDGIVTTPIGTGHDYGRSVIQLDDGKLVVAGFTTNSSGFTDFALVRYHADGSLDTSFGGGAGIVTTSVGVQNDEAYTVIQQGDGKLVVAGLAFDAAGISNFAMARYNADGSLDASFGGGSGIVSTAVGPSFDFGFTVIQQSDGKLVMVGFAFAGASHFDVALTRYNADGTLDTSFGGGDGIVTTPIGPVYDYAWTVLQQSDGKLVVGAHTLNASGNEDFALIRYNADGSLDAGFGGGDGIVTTAVGPGNDRGFSVVQQADGKLVLAGYALGASGNYDYALVRYNADGSLDTSFGGGTGIVTTPVSAGDDLGYTATLQSDGKLVIVGFLGDGPTHFKVALVRYNPDGSLDTTFGETGMPDQTITEGTAFAISVPANLFMDPDGDAIAYSATLADSNALPSWIAFDATTGLLSGTAPEGAGTIDVRITATDTTGLSTSDTFALSIASVNVPPTAADASLSTSEDVTLNGTLPVATDADGDPVSYALAAPPGNGTALVNADGSFTYTPNPDFNGSDGFLYSVSDSNSGSNTYTVNLTVTPAADPATISGTVSGAVIEDSAPSASGALGVSDPDAGEAAFIPHVATPGTYGSFSLDANGNWTYLLDNAHPAVQSLPTGGSAIDAFSVSSLDGTATQTVSITIHGTNDAPTLSASVAATLDEDSTSGGTAVASDVDTGAVLTYSAGAPAVGSVSIDPNSGAWTYTPSADYHGNDGFLISVSDEHGALAQQLVSLTITSINDTPTAADAAYSTAEDTLLSTTLPVAADADGDTVSYSSGDTAPQHGSVLINPDGSFSYTPNLDYSGSDTFSYRVADPFGAGNQYLVNLAIGIGNDPPVASDVSLSTSEDVALNGALPVATDADGDPVSYALASAPGNGTVVVNADGSFSYNPSPNFYGSDSFLYSVSDTNGGSNTYTANLTVDAVNDAATIVGTTSGTATKDTQLTASGALTVQDPDAGEAAPAPQSGIVGSYGSFSIAANGLWSYALDNGNAAVQALGPGDTLTDSFTVQSLDGTATQPIEITIHGQSGHPPQLTPAVDVFGATDGIALLVFAFADARSLIQQSDGNLVLAGGAFDLVRVNPDGSLDTSFGGGDGITTMIPGFGGTPFAYDVVQQGDGKLVAVGQSYPTGSTYQVEVLLARYNADGSLDTSFGGGVGIVTTALELGSLAGCDVVQQPDGKIVVSGTYSYPQGEAGIALIRYNVDGSLDDTFGSGDGIATTPGFGFDQTGDNLILQGDGKLVVAATDGLVQASLLRYNQDGSLDTSFGGGDGIASNPAGAPFYGSTVAQQSDGRLVVGGYVAEGISYDFALARFDADGAPDTTFGGGDGVATAPLVGINHDFPRSVIQQSDGKLVLGGYTSDALSQFDFAAARFNADGSLDTSFGGGDGIVITETGAGNSMASSVIQQEDGQLVLTGYAAGGLAIVRYNPDGSLDTTFGDPGMLDQVVTMGVPFSITIPANLFTDPDGDALTYSASGYGIGSVTFDAVTGELSGTVPVGYTDLYVYVTATDSTGLSAYDSFHITITQAPSLQSGIVRTSIGASSGARSLIEQGDGKLVTAGYGINSTTGYFEFALVRHNENGSLDTTFGDGDGIVTTAPGYNAVGHSVIQQADGKLVVAGIDTSFTTGGYEFTLLRYNTDGTLDSSFGEGDGVVTTAAYVAYGTSVIQQADGRLVLAASSLDSTAGSYQLVMVRYNADGSLDNGFGDGDGVVETAGAFYSSNVIQQADGKLVVAGAGSYEFTLVRYNVDGSLDTSFGDGGGVVTPAAGIVYATNVIQQADGKLVVAAFEYSFAAASYQLTLVRYNSDGAMDASFGDGDGVVTTAGLYMVTDALSVIQQTDGKLVVTAATHDTLSGAYDLALIRYDVDGSLDTGFGTSGIATAPIAGTNEFANDVVQLSDGKLAVSGYGYNGSGNDSVLARFNPDGSLDTTFGFVIGDQSIAAGEPYAFTISPTLFRDPEGGALTYSVTQSSGDALPAWLSFNAATGLLSGTPPVGSADLSLRVIATDPLGASSYVDFDLAIADTYVFGDGFGPQVLTGFTPGDAGADVIDLTGVTNPDWSTFADVQGALSQQGEDAFIDLGNGNSITLVGVAASALNSADFVL